MIEMRSILERILKQESVEVGLHELHGVSINHNDKDGGVCSAPGVDSDQPGV